MTEPDRESEVYDGDFFEEDEPIEKIMAIVARGFDGVTAPPGEAVVTVDDSPWLQRVHTAVSLTGQAWVERKKPSPFGLRPTGAASS